MFRPMRRSQQLLPESECLEILSRREWGTLGVIGDDGWPYTVPVNYIFHDGKLIFHCAKSGHKLDAMKADDRVSFCVVDTDQVWPERLLTLFSSVIVFGRARILTDEAEKRAAIMALGMHYYPNEKEVTAEADREMPALCCVQITIEHMTGKEAGELHRRRMESSK